MKMTECNIQNGKVLQAFQARHTIYDSAHFPLFAPASCAIYNFAEQIWYFLSITLTRNKKPAVNPAGTKAQKLNALSDSAILLEKVDKICSLCSLCIIKNRMSLIVAGIDVCAALDELC